VLIALTLMVKKKHIRHLLCSMDLNMPYSVHFIKIPTDLNMR